ncbi:MAG TPA: aminotransferase class V-fold PLP-dependent enzyme [Acidobacteriota bacterium]|nr:aminotransferase class V-fold PLP-dependent enzyme [Acidobacteriota bacterium]
MDEPLLKVRVISYGHEISTQSTWETDNVKRIYLDNAATTFPKPETVLENTIRFMRDSAGNPGRGGHYFANSSRQIVEETRRRVALFLGVADPKRVIFTSNCTDSINMVLKGYLRPGSHVIASNLDHNAISRPLESLKRAGVIELTRLPFEQGYLNLDQLKTSINHSTTLIVLTHGSNVLGTIQNLEEIAAIARAAKVLLLVDAAQTAGRIQINADSAPMFVACSAHKSLFGLPGLGILTLPENVSLPPMREGGTGTSSESVVHPDQLPERLEAGTPNVTAIASLRFALDFIESEGVEAIHRKEMELVHDLLKTIRTDDRFLIYSDPSMDPHVAVVGMNICNVPAEEAAAILDQNFGIAVRAGLHCAAVLHQQLGTLPGGCLRISPSVFNTKEEIAQLVEALHRIAEQY